MLLCINLELFYPLNIVIMKSNFELSGRLRLFLSIAVQGRCSFVGSKCPVSICRRYAFSQDIVIFPEAQYQFFTGSEVHRVISLADALGLTCYVSSKCGVPVIEISDYIK